jgi:hypothetical protein
MTTEALPMRITISWAPFVIASLTVLVDDGIPKPAGVRPHCDDNEASRISVFTT